MSTNSKYFLFSLVLLALVVAPSALAQEFVPLAPIPGLTDAGSVTTTEGLPTFFNNLYKLLIGLAAVAAVIQIIRSGIELALNQGSVSEIISAKGRVAQSLYGLILVLTPALVFGIINPNILNLSVALPDLAYTDRSSQSERVITTAREVNFDISGTHLQNAIFTSLVKERAEAEATRFINSCKNNGVFDRILSGDTFLSNKPVATCAGGLTNGSCLGGFSVQAQCAHRSGTPYTFVFIGGQGTYSAPFQLRATSPDSFDSFKSQCESDGGQTCILRDVNTANVKSQSVDCPPIPFATPQDAPDVNDGGRCQKSYVVCSPPDVAESTLCARTERIYD